MMFQFFGFGSTDLLEVRASLGEDFPGYRGVAFETIGVNASTFGACLRQVIGFQFLRVNRCIGLLPVAFAVPEVAGLVLFPKVIVFGQE